MSYQFLSTASTTSLVGNVISAFGQNFDAVAVIVGLAVAIPLTFAIAHYLKGLFSTRGRR